MTQAELDAIRVHFTQTGSLTKQQSADLLDECGQLQAENTTMKLRLTIDAMRNLTSKQIDEVCQRIVEQSKQESEVQHDRG